MSFASISLRADQGNPPGVILNKVVKEGTNPNEYKICLEAYVTGKMTIEHDPVPLDVALVLDASSSMTGNVKDYVLDDTTKPPYVAKKSNVGSSNMPGKYDLKNGQVWVADPGDSFVYYYFNGEYYKVCGGVHRISSSELYYFLCFDAGGVRYFLPSSGGDPVTTEPHDITSADTAIWTEYLYRSKTDTRINVLKKAVASFLDMLNEDESHLPHNVSVVRFAGNYKDSGNLLSIYNSNKASSVTALVTNFVDVSDSGDLSNLKTAVNNINMDAMGASTSADYGMNIAEALFNQSSIKNDGRPKVVVMFTDGEPNHGGDNFNADVANAVVAKAKTMKAQGVKVFTVGLFNSAYDKTSDVLKYMYATSSNFKDASTYNVTIDDDHEKGYAQQVTNGGALMQVFQTIAQQTIEGGAAYGYATETSTVVDIVAESFMLPEGIVPSDVDVKFAQCKSVDPTGPDGSFVFGFYDPVSPAAAGFTGVSVSVNEETKRVSVTGFDFSGNFVGEDVDGTQHKPRGWKMIIEFPILIDPRNPGGATVATNAPGSGLYCDTDGDGVPEQVAFFTIPTVKIPNIIVLKYGLHEGESATFNVYKVEDGGGLSEYPIVLVATQGGDREYAIARVKIQRPGRYMVKESTWSWAYNISECESEYSCDDNNVSDDAWHNAGYGPISSGYAIEIPVVKGTVATSNSITRNVNDFTEEEKTGEYKGTLFIFRNEEKTGVPAHAEAFVNNEFFERD